ncbi:unnamed protein product [Porites evermanni]|uniref:Protein TEX261 n=1 Tax=Porites evermanni TaxID=104178 RepID=A0ABN8MGM7_9CNID|nr:unnamed protein product [Porites evermanni]
MFLYILSWISMIFHVIFLTLALAAALFYLAELVEEYTVVTAKVIKCTIAATTVVYLGLLVLESFPFSIIIAGILTNGLYFLKHRNLSNFKNQFLRSESFPQKILWHSKRTTL